MAVTTCYAPGAIVSTLNSAAYLFVSADSAVRTGFGLCVLAEDAPSHFGKISVERMSLDQRRWEPGE